jgi:hypothetical protein
MNQGVDRIILRLVCLLMLLAATLALAARNDQLRADNARAWNHVAEWQELGRKATAKLLIAEHRLEGVLNGRPDPVLGEKTGSSADFEAGPPGSSCPCCAARLAESKGGGR